MMTLHPPSTGLIEEAVERLRSAGIDRPVFEAQLLLALAAGVTRLEVLRGIDQILNPDVLCKFREFLQRRCVREPLAYIRGSQEFYGLDFKVSPAVLIPRPETEPLVEIAIERLRTAPHPMVVDVGTGSGCIAISVAKALQSASVIGIDTSAEALEVARENASKHEVSSRVRFVRSNLAFAIATESVEMIVANPPYIAPVDIDRLEPEIRRYEPRMALDGGPDGLAFHRELIVSSLRALRPSGRLAVEIGFGQGDCVRALVTRAGLLIEETRRDLAGIERVIVGQKT